MNLKELADSLNLSPTTVSRALNGYPEVREETRARVLAAAKAANYAPNSRARRLATGRAMTIGHVIPLTGRAEMVNPIFADFLIGAGEVYAREGYDLLLSMVTDGDTEGAFRQLAANGSVDGVMVQAPVADDPRIALLKELDLPFLVHGRTGDPTGYSWLDIANIRAFRRATDFLLDLGHRRIALLNGQEAFDFAQRRRRGFEEALAARGLAPLPHLMADDAMTESFGYLTASAMLDGPEPPTAFLASSVIIAIGIRRAASERGLRLGRDLSVICHDDELSYLNNDVGGPAFTATRSSIRAAGRRCAEILIELIRHPERPPIQELWDTDLTVGQSTGPCPTR
ncbi:substrate-binding domain-containing protein [Roseicyclus persicicus]|uniref:LacI family DNA-binding transcriptional regulator n=1 Tax=Roseicyclus persicicus TaxID=2650661 RepID=A0A7X6H3L8_9RHOB|nr:substrate-binding domain-containing protein [Roseibacterium persicicum]NKX46177.1 LacI family DNA-binding transcriptional regulator [Roseibacterium persicicum]